MAPKIPKYNNWWEELFPSPEMSRNPDVRSGKRKKMVGPLHVNRWGPNKEAWGKIGRFILGLPSQEEIEKYAKIRNNRVNNTQQPVELPPAAQNSLYDSQGRNVFDGTTLKGENERKAELISNANKTSLASKVNSEETPNSSDPQTARSTVFTRNKEGEALGVMTRNQRKNWEADNPDWQSWQPEGKGYATSSAINNEGNPVPTKEIKTETVKSSVTNNKFQIPEGPTQNFWNKDIPINFKEGIKSGATFSEIPKNIDLSGQALNPANMAKDMGAGISFAEGAEMNPLGEAGGISGAAALKIGSMILGALSKKKGGGGYVKEAGNSDINKSEVPIASNIEDFYSGLRLT